jgi:predicted ester cyclase
MRIPVILQDFYRAYIDCLNRQSWDELGRYVADDARHNGRPFGLSGYRAMLIKDFEDIPDLQFVIDRLACDPPLIAARLAFDCRPKGTFLGLRIDGRRIAFTENVFYEVRNGRIADVWSIIDKAAVEAQIAR